MTLKTISAWLLSLAFPHTAQKTVSKSVSSTKRGSPPKVISYIKWDPGAEKSRQKNQTAIYSRSKKIMGEAGRDRRADNSGIENSGKINSYEALKRRHDGVACARAVAVAQCAALTEARRSAEKLAEENTTKTNQWETKSVGSSTRKKSGPRSMNRGFAR